MSTRKLAPIVWNGMVIFSALCAFGVMLVDLSPLSPKIFWGIYIPCVLSGIACVFLAWRYGIGQKHSESELTGVNIRLSVMLLVFAAMFAVLSMNNVRFDTAIPFAVMISHVIVMFVLWRRNYTWSKK